MQRAVYGRMKIGRCMKRDYGMTSCYSDQLLAFDLLCSGRFNCEVMIPDHDLTATLSCLEDLSPYLEASYKCQSGMIT